MPAWSHFFFRPIFHFEVPLCSPAGWTGAARPPLPERRITCCVAYVQYLFHPCSLCRRDRTGSQSRILVPSPLSASPAQPITLPRSVARLLLPPLGPLSSSLLLLFVFLVFPGPTNHRRSSCFPSRIQALFCQPPTSLIRSQRLSRPSFFESIKPQPIWAPSPFFLFPQFRCHVASSPHRLDLLCRTISSINRAEASSPLYTPIEVNTLFSVSLACAINDLSPISSLDPVITIEQQLLTPPPLRLTQI